MEIKIPMGIKVISIIYYIAAAIYLIFGLLFLLGAGFVGSIASKIPLITLLGTGLFIFIGVLLSGLGALCFFIGKGLWNAKNWARIAAIVLTSISLAMGLFSLMSRNYLSVIGLAINGFIAYYLFFDESVKKAFLPVQKPNKKNKK